MLSKSGEEIGALEILKRIFKVSLPLLISNSSFAILLFCDRTMLAHYNLDAAGASMGAGIISFTIQSFFMGIAIYTTTLIAQYYGANDKKMVAVSLWQSLYFVLIVGLTVPFLSRPLGIWILELADHDPHIIEMEKLYYSYMVLFLGVALNNIVLSAFFNGRSQAWVATLVNVCGCFINVFLNYVFIFGHYGVPAMGISGAAIATILAGLCTSLIFWIFIISLPSVKEYHIFREWRFRKISFLNLLRFGVPTGIMFGLDNSAFAVQILFTGRIGRDALNASTITLSLQNLVFMPILSFAQGAGIVMAQFIGLRRKDLGKKAIYHGLWVSGTIQAIIGCLVILNMRTLFNFFCGDNSSELVFEITRTLLYLMLVVNFFDVLNIGYSNALRAAGDTVFPMLTSLGLGWFFTVPSYYLIAEVYHLGVQYMWIAMGLMIMALAIINIWRFHSGAWEKFEVMETRQKARLKKAN